MIKLTYYGHSCIILENKGYAVAVDPYDEKTGYGELKIKANAVYCSHEHGDHAYVQAVEILEGGEKPFSVEEFIVPHDHEEGHKRGLNKIRIFEADGIKIAHFGDTGCMPDDCILERLKGVDVALIPVGGFFTIDAAEAKAICDIIKPATIIPMHYFTGTKGIPRIAQVSEFTEKFENVNYTDSCTIEIDGSAKGIVVLTA